MDEDEEEDEVVQAQAQAQAPEISDLANLSLSSKGKVEAEPGQSLQLTDLATENPLLMYEGQLYSCEWASSIGSDLLFMHRDDERNGTSHADYTPLHSFKEVDLVGIGAARLVASSATLERRRADEAPGAADDALAPASAPCDEVLRQAHFMSRMADVRTKRKENAGNLKSTAQTILGTSDRPSASVKDGQSTFSAGA